MHLAHNNQSKQHPHRKDNGKRLCHNSEQILPLVPPEAPPRLEHTDLALSTEDSRCDFSPKRSIEGDDCLVGVGEHRCSDAGQCHGSGDADEEEQCQHRRDEEDGLAERVGNVAFLEGDAIVVSETAEWSPSLAQQHWEGCSDLRGQCLDCDGWGDPGESGAEWWEALVPGKRGRVRDHNPDPCEVEGRETDLTDDVGDYGAEWVVEGFDGGD